MSGVDRIMCSLIAAMLLAGPSVAQNQAQDNLNKGMTAFRNADYESAVNFFKQALELDPSSTLAEFYLATAYSQHVVPGGDPRRNAEFAEKAIESFRRVLRREPDNVNAVFGLAGTYQNTNDLQNARETYLQASKLVPRNPVS